MKKKENPHMIEEDFQYRLLYLPRGIERLAKLGTVKHFPKDTILNEVGIVPEYCYIVKTGRVVCYEISYAGDQQIYNIMAPTSIFLDAFMLTDKPSPVQFKTIEDCELIRIEKSDLKQAFRQDFDIVMDVIESLSVKFLSAMEHQRLGPRQNASWKICRMLLISAKHDGTIRADGSCIFNRKISHQMLADILGMNRVTVTRKLKELKELDLVDTIDGYFYIKNLHVLQNYMADMEMIE